MTKRKNFRPKTADFPLSRSLTDSFIASLTEVLNKDDGWEARYLSDALLSKFTELDSQSASVRRSRAIEKWLTTEATNELTNRRIRAWKSSDHVSVLPGVSSRKFFEKLREIVAQIVPWMPSLDLANGGFSGGASTSTKRVHGHPAMKFLDKADVTRPALPIFREIIRGSRWADHMGDAGVEANIVSGNVMFTVPKNATIDRVACKEPDLNMFLQKGLGNQIRSCLRRVGIDLNDQTRNQELARLGAVTGSLMTLDLSSASDSVTYELVKAAMPSDWFFYLNAFRSERTDIDGVEHVNEMFSSMGNGFTFELESLLFFAIARTTAYFTGVRGKISVYGDDIIAPVGMGQDLISTLAFCGFTTNPDKSFMDGPFRESCGKHWHGDLDVTPFYLRRPFQSVSDLILTLNQLTNWASRTLGVVDPRYEAIILEYAEYVPEDLWGGSDVTSRYSLVTGDRPRKELVFKSEDQEHDHAGGLLFWMHLALNRVGYKEAIRSSGSRTSAIARVRTRRNVDIHDIPVFLSKQKELLA